MRSTTPKYRHHKASDRAVVHIDGRDVYLGPYDSPESHKQYNSLVKAYIQRRDQAERKRKSDQIAAVLEKSAGRIDWTIVELTLKYLPHVRGHYTKHGEPTSQVGLIEAALSTLVGKFGELDAVKFGPLALKEYREALVSRGYCRNEVNRRTRLVVQMFQWAVGEELVPQNIWGSLRAVKGLQRGRTKAPDHPPVGPVADAHVDATLPFLPRPVAGMVRLQTLGGMRPSEVVAMRADEIDMSGSVWEYTPSTHKTEHRGGKRVIMIGPKGQAIIREFLRPDLSIFQPSIAPSPYVFPPDYDRQPRSDRTREPGDRYTVTSYRRAIARACDRAKVPQWSPNQLRHTAATRIRRELGLDVSRALLGHSDVSMTEIYAERDSDLARTAMERFG